MLENQEFHTPDTEEGKRVEKRFTPAQEGFAKERLDGMKSSIEELKAEDPAVLSFALFGSMARGNAHKDSDIDGYLFVDEDRLKEEHDGKEVAREKYTPHGVDTFLEPGIRDEYMTRLAGKMGERTDMTAEKVKEGVKIRPVSERIIKEHINNLVSSLHMREKYHADFDAWADSRPADRTDLKAMIEHEKLKPQYPDTVSASDTLTGMFHLDMGGGIRPYRARVVAELAKLGPDGEEAWRQIIQGTEMLENDFSTTNKYYPRTLEEAEKKYLQ